MDGEETTLVVIDTWEPEKRVGEWEGLLLCEPGGGFLETRRLCLS